MVWWVTEGKKNIRSTHQYQTEKSELDLIDHSFRKSIKEIKRPTVHLLQWSRVESEWQGRQVTELGCGKFKLGMKSPGKKAGFDFGFEEGLTCLIYVFETALWLQCHEQAKKVERSGDGRPLWQVQAAWGWQRSGMTARWRGPQTWVVASEIRWKTGLWETPLKEENQNVVTRKEVPEKTLGLGAWDLKIRGRMTAWEPSWGLKMRDVDLSAQRDKWNQTKSVSREYKKKGKMSLRRPQSKGNRQERGEGGRQKIRMVHCPWKRKGF